MCTGESPQNFPSHPHEDDTCPVTPCTAIQGPNKHRFSEEPLGTPLWAMEFLFFRAEGTLPKNDNTKVTLGLARLLVPPMEEPECVSGRGESGAKRKVQIGWPSGHSKILDKTRYLLGHA